MDFAIFAFLAERSERERRTLIESEEGISVCRISFHVEGISTAFRKLPENNGLCSIRFHDLRHSCASMMLAKGVAMKQIQEWLGHSDFSTTANIYAHLDAQSKSSTADAMLRGLGFASPEDSSP